MACGAALMQKQASRFRQHKTHLDTLLHQACLEVVSSIELADNAAYSHLAFVIFQQMLNGAVA